MRNRAADSGLPFVVLSRLPRHFRDTRFLDSGGCFQYFFSQEVLFRVNTSILMAMLIHLGIFLGGYLIGAIPFTYLIVRKWHRVDLRDAGSRSVGGFNAYFVTGSKGTGVLVGVLDGMKGLAAVYGADLIGSGEYTLQGVALLGAIVGHNYSVWLRFKGGRGLATTAGGMFILGFSYTVVWCTIWLLSRLFRRDILTANLLAIFLTPAVLGILPWRWVDMLIAADVQSGTFLFFSCVLSFLLLVGHRDAVSSLWSYSRTEKL
jgi:glycerol-3-phosphate acyltransferase PlsY